MAQAEMMTMAAYARRRGVSRNAVARAVRDGRIVLIGGKLDAAIADAQWSKNTRPRAGNTKDAAAINDGESRYATARADREQSEAALSALRLRETEGNLINREGVEMAIETGFRMIRDAMMTVPERMALDATTQAKMREAIRAALDDAIKAVAPAMMPSSAQPVAAGG